MSDRAWDFAVESRHVVEALSREFPDAAEKLLNRVDALLDAERDLMKGRTRVPVQPATVQGRDGLSSYERRRFEVASLHLARFVATLPQVRRFRLRGLHGEVLDAEQVRRLVGSLAAQSLSAEDFEREGIEILAHTASLEAEGARDDGLVWRRIRVSPPGKLVEVSGPPAASDASRAPGGPPLRERRELAVFDGEREQRLEVSSGSVLGELASLAIWLGAEFGWEPAWVSWFLLTGDPPVRLPIREEIDFVGERSPYTCAPVEVRLTVQPWVSAATVARRYRKLQRGLGVAANTHAISDKALDMFSFVGTVNTANENHLPWRQLLADWNRRCDRGKKPKEHYANQAQMCEAYKNVQRRLHLVAY